MRQVADVMMRTDSAEREVKLEDEITPCTGKGFKGFKKVWIEDVNYWKAQ